MKRDNPTYRSVAARYDEYVKILASKPEMQKPERALPPQRPYTPQEEQDDMGRTVSAAIGFGIGALLLLLAAWSFVVSAKWAGLDRAGAANGYFLVGFFLLLSGGGGILATWNHNYRVLTRRSGSAR
ncbi:MAG TPA: hypothetical protein VF167_10330 [Longimicrobiaceae bacterium]